MTKSAKTGRVAVLGMMAGIMAGLQRSHPEMLKDAGIGDLTAKPKGKTRKGSTQKLYKGCGIIQQMRQAKTFEDAEFLLARVKGYDNVSQGTVTKCNRMVETLKAQVQI